jgi:hypothetical protein
MKYVLVRKHLIPHMNKISSLMTREFEKIEDNADGDRGEVMLSIALSVLYHITDGNPELACAIASRVIRDCPSSDDHLHQSRITVLSPEFVKVSEMLRNDPYFAQLFPQPIRKH